MRLVLQMLYVAWSVYLCVSVCQCVCLCVGHMGELCKNVWTDWDLIWGLTHMHLKNHVLDGGQNPPMGRGNIGGRLAHWKSLGVCCSVCSKNDHSVVNNGTKQQVPNKQKKVLYINFGPIFMPTSSRPAATWQVDNVVISRLRSSFKFPVPFARTNKFQSFINYGLRWYQ